MSAADRRALVRSAQGLLRDQRWAEALPLLDRCTRELPDQWQVWQWRAGCLARLGRLAEALGSARRAAELAPDEEKAASLVRSLETRLETAAASVRPPRPAGAPGPAPVDPYSTARLTSRPEATLAEGAPEAEYRTLANGTQADYRTLADTPGAAGNGTWSTLVDRDRTDFPADDATLVEPGGAARPSPEATLAETGVDHPPGPAATWQDRPAGSSATGPLATLAEAVPVVATAGAAAPRLALGEVVEGRYEVRGSAQGGMGEVSFVHDRELGLDLAIKTPLPGTLLTEAGRARFLREAEAWIALGLHPHVCTAYYVRELHGLPRLFIEYLPGGTLEEWMTSNRGSGLSERLDLAIQVAAGMNHAHTCAFTDERGVEHPGLVHRDLKPANVLLGDDGTARVTDFGLVGLDADLSEGAVPEATAAAVGRSPEPTATGSVWATVTLGGRVLGSPPYMAPEQWTGAHAAGRPADLYAFGCILFELVCRRRPFLLEPRLHQADPEVQRRTWEHLHRNQPPPDPRLLVPDLDPALADLMLACLTKDQSARPRSFAEVGLTLREVYGRVTGAPYPRPEPRAAELLADSLNNRGVSFASLGHLNRAELAWREALAADPQHPQASFNLGLLEWRHRGAGDQQLVNRVEGVRSEGPAAWRQLLLAGRAHLATGRLPGAVERLRAAADAAGTPETVRELVLALAGLAAVDGDPDRWRQVEGAVARAGDWAADDPALLTAAALAADRLGDPSRSAELWAEARRRLPDPPAELALGVRRLIPGAALVRRLGGVGTGAALVDVSRDGRLALAVSDIGRLSLFDLDGGLPVRGIRGRQGRPRCLALVAERGLALTVTGGEAVVVWDLNAGVARRTLQMHAGYLNALVPTGDGRSAFAIGSTGTLFTWDLDSGRRLLAVKALEGYASALGVTPGGEVAVVGGGDGSVRSLELPSGQVVYRVQAHAGEVTALAVADDGGRALSGGADGFLCVHDLRGGRTVERLGGHVGPIRFVALSPDGRRALSAGDDGTLRLRDLGSGEVLCVHALAEAVEGAATAADWSAVVVAHGAGLSQLCFRSSPRYRPPWAVSHLVTASAAQERAGRFRSHLERVRHLAADQDYATAFHVIAEARSVSGYERSREALEVESRLAAMFPRGGLRDAWGERVLAAHAGPLTATAVCPRRPRAVSAGRDQRLVMWDLGSGVEVGRVEAASVPVALALLADGTTTFAAHLDNVVRRWDFERPDRGLPLYGHEARVHHLAVDPASRSLLSASADHTARVWDPATGDCRHLLEGHLGQVLSAAVSPDGRLGLTGGDDGTLLLWDLDRGRPAGELAGAGGAVTHLDWSLDGRFALATSRDGFVRLFDVRAKRCLRTLGEGLTDPAVATLSPEARWALVGEASGRVGLWDLRERRVVRTLDGHTAPVVGVHFDRSGRLAVTGAEDGTLRLSYLDWEPKVRPFAEWDEVARPHLEVFLSQHTRPAGNGAREVEWQEEDFRELLLDLGHRGLGWLRPDGVRARLEEAAEAVRQPEEPRAQASRLPTRASTPHSREARGRQTRRAMIAAILVAALALVGLHLRSRNALHYDTRELEDRRERNLALLVVPSIIARPSDCSPDRLPEYLREFTEPSDSPAAWATASYCLVALKDPRVVAPMLDTLRPRDRGAASPLDEEMQVGSRPQQVLESLRRAMLGGVELRAAVQSMLARVGEAAVPALTRALDDPDPTVRRTAAGALGLNGSPTAIAALVERARAGSAHERAAVAAQLANIAVSGRLDARGVFDLATALAEDRDPEVRRSVVPELRIFRGSRPRTLVDRLRKDADEGVRKAAQGLPG